MTITYVLMQNLKRNPLRTSLTLIAFALPMAVFVIGISVLLAFNEASRDSAAQLRLAAQSKIALVNPLPQRIRKEILALDPNQERIRGVCGFRWFGGRVPNSQGFFPSFGIDADTVRQVYSEWNWTDEEEERWLRDRRALLVGSEVARAYKWDVGSRVTMQSSIPPYLSLEFNVVKVLPSDLKTNTNVVYLRHDFYEESRKEKNAAAEPGYNVIWIRCNSAAAQQTMQAEIDAHFANTSNETKTMDENAFGWQFIESSGDIIGLLGGMSIVVVVIVSLVAGNTMMMSFRERMRELAVFKAIGFQGSRVFRIVLAESTLLAVTGALIGIVPIALLLTAFPPKEWKFVPPGVRVNLAALHVSPSAVLIGLGIALVVGIFAGLAPAYQSWRLNTVAALRRIG